MATIEELRREISKQKDINLSIQEMRKLEDEKRKLELELKSLKRQNKWGNSMESFQKIGAELKKAGSKFMEEAGKAKRNMEINEKRNESLFRI